jgi:hypothetical protein
MTKPPMRWVLPAFAVCIFGVSPIEAFVRCRTADGKLHFVDVPPEGCTVDAEFHNRPAVPEQDAPAAERDPSRRDVSDEEDERAMARRDDIERALQQAAAKRVELLAELRSLEYPPPPAGGTPADQELYRKKVAEIGDMRTRLESEIAGLLTQIAQYRQEFESLSRETAAANRGQLPVGWRTTLDCPGCP